MDSPYPLWNIFEFIISFCAVCVVCDNVFVLCGTNEHAERAFSKSEFIHRLQEWKILPPSEEVPSTLSLFLFDLIHYVPSTIFQL